MLNAEWFTHFGMYVVKGFFDPELCARLRSEVCSATGVASTVWDKGDRYIVDESLRRTKTARVAESTVSFVEARLLAIKPALESHFSVVTSGLQRPQFLLYKEGDFFGVHSDSINNPDASEFVTARRVSVVIYLNGESEEPEPDTYAGGSLTFYGFWDDPALKKCGFPLVGEAGLLIAFRSEVVHAVTPVTRGERYTIVSWLEG
jgi:SM-20-related protein